VAAGIAAAGVVWIASLIVNVLAPGFDPVRRSISALANTPAGGLMTAAFVATGLLELAFAVGLPRVLGTTRAQRGVVAVTLGFLGLLTLLFAVFPTDPPGAPRSPSGTIHLLAALAYALALPACGLVFAVLFARDPRWARLRLPTLVIALAQVLLFPVLMAAVTGGLRPYLGLVERVSFAIPSVWQVGVALFALRLLPSESLQPAPQLEQREQHDRRDDHQSERERVAEVPAQLRDVGEVHAVHRPDERRREQDRRPG
jgi:hypothetical membrane protein